MGWSSGLTLGPSGGTPTAIAQASGTVYCTDIGAIYATPATGELFQVITSAGGNILAAADGSISIYTTAAKDVTIESGGDASIMIEAGGNLYLSCGDPGAITLNDQAIALGGPLTTTGSVTWHGAHSLDVTLTGNTSITLPTSGLLSTVTLPISAADGGTGLDASSAAEGALLIGTGSGLALANLTPGANITITNGDGSIEIAASGSEGISEVDTGTGLTGGPITTTGTIALDTPVSCANGGTGLDTSAASEGQLLIGNASGFSLATLTAGTNVSITNGAGSITIDAASSSGVTEVDTGTGLTGGPITTTGTIALEVPVSNANGGTGLDTSAAPEGALLIGNGGGFTLATLTEGTGITITDGPGSIEIALTTPVSPANGGSGVDSSSASDGELLIGNGSGLTLATLTPGAGISVANGAGSIAIAATGPPGLCQYRLTLSSTLPVTYNDVTAEATIWWSPFNGDFVSLYNGSSWALYQPGQLSIASSSLTANTLYDFYVYLDAGTPTLWAEAWTNTTTRSSTPAYTNGVLLYTGSGTPVNGLYVGTAMAATLAKFTDSLVYRGVWNYYNPQSRRMKATDATASWTYNSSTWRQARAQTTNQLNFVYGWQNQPLSARVQCATNSGGAIYGGVGIGVNSTSANSADLCIPAYCSTPVPTVAIWDGYPAVGVGYLAWIESAVGGTATYYSTGQAANITSGISGIIWG